MKEKPKLKKHLAICIAGLGIITGSETLQAQNPRPTQLPHLDDAIAVTAKQAPKHEDAPAGIFDFSQHDFPRLALTETKALKNELRYRLMHFISAQAASYHHLGNLKARDPNDPQFTVGSHRSPRANQDYTNAGTQGTGMGLSGLGPVTWGTKATPEMYVKHFLYGPATTLSANLSAGASSATVANGAHIKKLRYVIIYSGAKDQFLNPEFCYVHNKSGNNLTLVNNGGNVGRGYISNARFHNSGEWVRSVIIGAGNGNAKNFAYAFNDDADLEDGAGRTPWEAQALFDKNNYRKNKNGQTIGNYEPEVIFRDVDIHYIPPQRKADTDHDGSQDDGWSGQTNKHSEGVTLFNQKITEYFPTKHHVSGCDNSTHPHEYAGYQSEEAFSDGGQFTSNPSWHGVDYRAAKLDFWQHYTGWNKGVPLNITLSKRVDELYQEALPGNNVNVAPNGYRANRFIACMTWIGGGWFGRMNPGTVQDSKLPLYPEFFVYRGQPGLAGKGYAYGDCVFPYRNNRQNLQPLNADVEDALLAKGYLGQPLWPRVRIYNHSDWEISDAIKNITFVNNISGWTKSGCNISHNAAQDSLQFDSWTAGAKKNYGNAKIDGPTVNVTKNKWYTMVMEVKCTASVTRNIQMGLIGEEIQRYPIGTEWHLITNTFKAKSTGNKKIRLEVGLFKEKFLVKSVRVWQGTNRVFRRDFEHGIVLANNGPQTTIDLGGEYQMLRLPSNRSQYDPEGRLTNGGLVTQVTLKDYDGIVLLNPESTPPPGGGADYEETFDDGLAQGWSTNNYNLTNSQLRHDPAGGNWAFATTTNVAGLDVDDNYSVSVNGRALGTRNNSYDSPCLVLKYKDASNWAYIYINHDNSGGPRTLRFKSKIGSTVDEHDLPLAPGSNLQNIDVGNWNTIKATIDGSSLTVRVSGNLEVDAATENALSNAVFDSSTITGVRAPTAATEVAFDNFRFWNENGGSNGAPALAPIADVTMDEGTSVTVNLNATDPDSDPITLVESGVPSFGTFTDNGDGTGSITLTPWWQASGNYIITVTASDGSLTDTQSFNLTVNNIDRAPTLDPIADVTMDEGTSITVNLNATDPDGDNITLIATGVPGAFGTFTDNGDGTGTIGLSPWYDASDNSPWTINVTASAGSLNNTESFDLTVDNVNRAPELDSITNPNPEVDENSSITINISASDPDGDPITFGATGLPSFGTLTDNGAGTGNITFSPSFSDAGVYSITISASDGLLTDTAPINLTVNNVNRQPSITPISDQTVEEDCNHAFQVTASDPDTDDTLTLSVSGLPEFGTFTDNGDGTALLVLDPVSGDAGPYNNITLTVNDGNASNNTSSTSFDLAVTKLSSSGIIYSNDFSSGTVAEHFTGATGDFTIAGGELTSVNSDVYKTIQLKSSIFDSSTDSFKIVSRIKKGAGNGYQGASLRFRDIDTNNWYELQIRDNDGIDVRIYGKSSGVAATVGQWDTDLDPMLWNTFSLILTGSDLSVYLGNNLLGTATLGHNIGRVGLRQRSNDAWWDYYRVVEIDSYDYIEDFDDGLAQSWSSTTDFNPVDIGDGDYALKQVSSAWGFSSYNSTVSVDANYSFSIDGRTVGTRTKSFESPTVLVKYKDANNWISIYVDQNPGSGDRSIKLKKKIAGVATETTIASNITSLNGVGAWHSFDIQVNGNTLNVWVNAVLEVANYTEPDLSNATFDTTTSCGVRSTTSNVSVEYDNFIFYDEYGQ